MKESLLLNNFSATELTTEDLVNIDGGNNWFSAASVYATSFGLLALGGPVTIAVGAVAHVAGIWMLADMGKQTAEKYR